MPVEYRSVTTVQELQALPEDDLRHELLGGVHVVTPAPRLPHQATLSRLLGLLLNALADRQDFAVFPGGDVVLGTDTLVIPDLLVIEQDPEHPATSWDEIGVPVLAVEILSPSTAARDRGIKRRIYQRAGATEYWIVDLDARLIERWRPHDERPEILTERFMWTPKPDVTVEVVVGDLF